MTTANPTETQPPDHVHSWLVLAPRTVWRVGLGLVILQAVLRLLMGLGAYFTQDDFVFYTLGASEPFDLAYLFQDRGNHLMPAGQAIVWPLANYLPLEHGPAVLVMVLVQLLASLAVLGLLRELFGRRTAILAPLSFYLFGALTLPAFLWWAASLNSIGLQLGMALAIRCHVRWLRNRRWRAALGTCLATLLGLAFFEKAVLIVPLLFGLTWVLEREHGAIRDLWRVFRRHWVLWVALLAEVGAWIGLYLHQVSTEYAAGPTTGVAADLVLDSVALGVVPATSSGPWAWTPAVSLLGYAPAPPTLLLLASWVGLVLFGALSLACRRGMGRMWVVAAGYLAADIALLVWGRAGAFGAGVALEYRYYADFSLVLALLIGYALLPVRGETEAWRAESAGLRAWLRRNADTSRAIGWVVLVLWCVGAVWSSIVLAEAWRTNDARVYIETAKRELASLPRETQLLDEPVPGAVVLAWFTPYNGTSYVLRPLQDRPEFVQSVTELWTITPKGRVVPGEVVGIRSKPGPNSGCGWAVTNGTTSIPLDRPVFEWNWTVKVGYLAGADTVATFTLGDTSVEVPLTRGLHDVYFALADVGSTIEVSVETPGVGVCIDRIDVGNRQAAADPDAVGLSPPGQP